MISNLVGIRSRIIDLILAILILQVIIGYFYLLLKYDYYLLDFRSFYSAAQILDEHPEKLYDIPTQITYQLNNLPLNYQQINEKFLPFVYPPIFLIPYLFLISLPLKTAFFVGVLFNLILLIVDLRLLYKLFPISKIKLLLLTLFIFSFAPTFTVFFLGQNSFITLFLYLIIFYLLQQKKYFISGFVSSWLIYKPQLAVILFIYLLFLRKRHIFWGLISGMFIILVTSLIMTHGQLFTLFTLLPKFVFHSTTQLSTRISWLGFFSSLQKYFNFLPVIFLTVVASIIIIYQSIRSIVKHQFQNMTGALSFSLIICTTLLAGFHIHIHESILLFFPLFYFVKYHFNLKLVGLLLIGWFIGLLFIFNFLTPLYPVRIPFLTTLYILCILMLIIRQNLLEPIKQKYLN